jgi:hypothetical protein
MAKRIVMSAELSNAITQVLEHLRQNPGEAKEDTKFWVECAFKYIRIWSSVTILVVLPNGDTYEPRHSGPGRLPNWERPMGNIIALVKRKNWQKQVQLVISKYGYAVTIKLGRAPRVPTCERPGCGRTNKVQQTVLGLGCAYCRAADMRHINDIRALGGMPRVNGRALKTNADYYKP